MVIIMMIVIMRIIVVMIIMMTIVMSMIKMIFMMIMMIDNQITYIQITLHINGVILDLLRIYNYSMLYLYFLKFRV